MLFSIVCLKIRTFDLQLAGDHSLSLGVLGSAGVHTTIEAAGLTDLQGANALVGELTKLGVVADDHLILQPLDLRLRGEEKMFLNMLTNYTYCIVCLRGIIPVKKSQLMPRF